MIKTPIKPKGPTTRINDGITAGEVRVVQLDGAPLGIMSLVDALDIASEENLDLVEVSPDANPPVCKIMDYGKFKFEQAKKMKEMKKNQHVIQLKEVKFRPKTDTHDFNFKLNNIRKFLLKGDRVKVFVVFKGREMAYTNFGRELLERIHEALKDIAKEEYLFKSEGRNMISLYNPDNAKIKAL